MSAPEFEQEISEAVECLRKGGVVALPTDTLYGLAADVFNGTALEKVFAIKGRPQRLALPVLIGGWEQLEQVARQVPQAARRLAEKFWPGPLTLVVPRAATISDLVTAGRDTVAVRMPNHRVPLRLASNLGSPITGTSANRSGGPDLLTLGDVEKELGHLADCIIRSGPLPLGVASTVVDLSGDEVKLLREGAVPFDRVMAALA